MLIPVQQAKQPRDNDDEEKGGPLGLGGDDGLLGSKLLSDDGVNIISDGKVLGIGNDDGLLNTGMLSEENKAGDA